MDRWILSKLNVFILDSEQNFESYRVDALMKKFDIFLDDLSNWYIRRNRRRFWKTEDDKDKITAYFVLYNVLLDTIKTMAPILPFVCEEMYQNLVVSIDKSAPESIHLCNYPKSNNDHIDHADGPLTCRRHDANPWRNQSSRVREPRVHPSGDDGLPFLQR